MISFAESGLLRKGLVSASDVTPKPYMQIKVAKKGVKIRFELASFSAIRIYSRRNGEEFFTLLGETSELSFIDERENVSDASEEREYKAIYVDKGEPIGEPDFWTIRTKGKFRIWF